jgi:uncharacterized cupin superfamily protein
MTTDFAGMALLTDAAGAALPQGAPKPTSLDGQVESSTTVWTSDDGAVEVGVWECSPGRFTAERDGYDEICQILVGSATVRSEDGTRAELAPGTTFVMPSGWRGTWEVHEQIRKVFMLRTLSQ